MILFYGYQGSYRGNVKYFFEYVITHSEKIFIPLWVSTNPKDSNYLHSKGINTIDIYNKKGVLILLYYLFIAKIIVFTSLGDLWKYRRLLMNHKHIFIELSNGITIKSAGVEAKFLQNNKKVVNEFINRKKQTTFHCVSSDTERYFISACFSSDIRKNIVTGEPRTDILLNQLKNTDKYKDLIISLYPNIDFGDDPRFILYAPSHRDGNYFINKKSSQPKYFIFDDYDYDNLCKNIDENNLHFLLRTHAIDANYTKEELQIDPKLLEHPNIHLFPSDLMADEVEVAGAIDLIVTDYSGIYIDFLLLDKPVLFYPYDLENYKKYRGLMFDYDLVTPGPKIYSQKGLFMEINKLLNESRYYHNERKLVKKMFFNYESDGASNRIYELIKNKLNIIL